MLVNRLRCGPALKPALVQRLVFAGLRSIAAGQVVLTAGGDYKPTLTQCLLNVGPASLVLVCIHLALVGTLCWGGAHAHSAWRAAAGSEMEVSAYFTSVHILSFGRAVTGKKIAQ